LMFYQLLLFCWLLCKSGTIRVFLSVLLFFNYTD
jgi:hypothetical protein